jgi:hypothetical protein
MPASRVLSPILLCVLLAASASPPVRADEGAGLDLASPDAVKQALGSRDARERLAAARAAVSLQDAKLTAPLVRLLKDDEPAVAEAALDALVARVDPKQRKAAAKGIAALLKPLKREPDAEAVAREKLLVPALHDLAQVVSIQALLDIHSQAPADLIKTRLHAVANVPSKEAIEELIDYAAKRRRGEGHGHAVGAALRYATGLKLGNDPDKWRAWWREAKDTFDFEAAAEQRAEGARRQEEKEARREEKRRRRREKPEPEEE